MDGNNRGKPKTLRALVRTPLAAVGGEHDSIRRTGCTDTASNQKAAPTVLTLPITLHPASAWQGRGSTSGNVKDHGHGGKSHGGKQHRGETLNAIGAIPSITSRCDDASRAVLHLDHAARPLHPRTPRLVEDPRDVVNQMTRPSGFPPISVQMMENDAVVGQDDQRLRCSRIEQADEFLRDQDRPQKRDGYFAFRRCLGV